eukprot:scaffold3107_cov155-Isochrysis_galbana.AAC.2
MYGTPCSSSLWHYSAHVRAPTQTENRETEKTRRHVQRAGRAWCMVHRACPNDSELRAATTSPITLTSLQTAVLVGTYPQPCSCGASGCQ